MPATPIAVGTAKKLSLNDLRNQNFSKISVLVIEMIHLDRDAVEYVVDRFRLLKSKKRVAMETGLAARVVSDIIDHTNLPDRKMPQMELDRRRYRVFEMPQRKTA